DEQRLCTGRCRPDRESIAERAEDVSFFLTALFRNDTCAIALGTVDERDLAITEVGDADRPPEQRIHRFSGADMDEPAGLTDLSGQLPFKNQFKDVPGN